MRVKVYVVVTHFSDIDDKALDQLNNTSMNERKVKKKGRRLFPV